MYTRLLALFSAVPYAAPDHSEQSTADYINEDLAAHLTNTSLQTDRGEAGVRLLDEMVGCHVVSSHFTTTQSSRERPQQSNPPWAMGEMLGAEDLRAAHKVQQADPAPHHDKLSAEDVENIKSQIAEILGETFKAALEMSVHFQVRTFPFRPYITGPASCNLPQASSKRVRALRYRLPHHPRRYTIPRAPISSISSRSQLRARDRIDRPAANMDTRGSLHRDREDVCRALLW